jgi:NADH-quinone oxidoreductase subunit H
MAQAGSSGFFDWFLLPLFPLFVIYWVSGVAETNRAPFDVVEGESEIVAGHMVEYSGGAFALFFLAEYANMILISFLISIFFLGGWLSPVQGWVNFGDVSPLVDWIWKGGAPWLFVKVFFFASAYIWFRQLPALPLRPDHAPGLEGLHPAGHSVDRGYRRHGVLRRDSKGRLK